MRTALVDEVGCPSRSARSEGKNTYDNPVGSQERNRRRHYPLNVISSNGIRHVVGRASRIDDSRNASDRVPLADLVLEVRVRSNHDVMIAVEYPDTGRDRQLTRDGRDRNIVVNRDAIHVRASHAN